MWLRNERGRRGPRCRRARICRGGRGRRRASGTTARDRARVRNADEERRDVPSSRVASRDRLEALRRHEDPVERPRQLDEGMPGAGPVTLPRDEVFVVRVVVVDRVLAHLDVDVALANVDAKDRLRGDGPGQDLFVDPARLRTGVDCPLRANGGAHRALALRAREVVAAVGRKTRHIVLARITRQRARPTTEPFSQHTFTWLRQRTRSRRDERVRCCGALPLPPPVTTRLQSIHALDVAAMDWIARRRHPAITRTMRWVTYTGEGRGWFIAARAFNLLRILGRPIDTAFLRAFFCPLATWRRRSLDHLG